MKKILLLGLFVAMGGILLAQELNVNVTINTPKLQLVDPKVFESMKSAIEEFYANTSWTNDIYETEEKININLSMTITEERSPTSFKADLTIQSSRPVYGSDYETVMFNHLDKDVTFSYEQFQPIQYTQSSFSDNLTSILSFYAFIVLGIDYDSFAPFGGEEYFQAAEEVMSTIPQNVASNNPGWRSIESRRNRYWLIENLLTPRVRPFRQAIYDYHRLGLDRMAEEPIVGRAIAFQALEEIAKVDGSYPNSMIMQVFSNSKSQEILSIFSQGTPAEKNKVISIMSKLDPSNSSEYRALR